MSKYKELRGKHGQEAAAVKTGISVASARRLESAVALPSQRPPPHWRTRADPLGEVCSAEVVPMLEGAPALMAVTVLEELQRRHPERFADAVLRTLQRRVSQRRAEHGGEREIYFAQECTHPAGSGCRTSPWPMSWASAWAGWASRTGCTSSHWPTAAGAMRGLVRPQRTAVQMRELAVVRVGADAASAPPAAA